MKNIGEHLCECQCGQPVNYDRQGNPRRFRRGHNHRKPGGGGWTDQGGYKYLSIDGKRVAEHRWIMSIILGRPLTSDEVVHHKNRIRWDNRPENLQVMTRSEHAKLHATGRKVKRWTTEEKALAISLYRQGHGIQAVADALGRPYQSTRDVLERAGVTRRPHETRRLWMKGLVAPLEAFIEADDMAA